MFLAAGGTAGIWTAGSQLQRKISADGPCSLRIKGLTMAGVLLLVYFFSGLVLKKIVISVFYQVMKYPLNVSLDITGHVPAYSHFPLL